MFKILSLTVAVSGLFALSACAEDAKYYKIVHAETGKVLAIGNNSEDSGAKIVIAKGDNTEAQQWKLEKDGDYFKLTNRKTGKVLDVEAASDDEGAAIIQWEDKSEDNDNQRWSWVGEGKTKGLKAKSSKLVLDIGDDSAVVQKKSDDKAKKQLWELVEIKK